MLLDADPPELPPDPPVTVIWPFIPSWMVQWYGYVPAAVNLTCQVWPGPKDDGDVRSGSNRR